MIKNNKITLSRALWKETIYGLRVRGEEKNESACIWAGQRSPVQNEVQEVIFLDDIAGVMGRELFHRVPTFAIDKLFSTLREKGLSIIADIHTHPENWVGLSWIDMEHPLEYRVGFLMIVLPYYASTEIQLKDIGVHEYQGNGKWRELHVAEIRRRIIIKES